MKTFSLQYPVRLGDVDANRETFLRRIAEQANTGPAIILLPEMWAFGFDYENLSVHAEKTESLCDEIAGIIGPDVLVVGSLPEPFKGTLFNTIYAVTKNGISARYRKNFLFSPMREDQYFLPGQDIKVFDFADTKVGLHTCYEIRFPELFRMSAYRGAELFLVPAIWPGFKANHWKTMLAARAIENQCYVLGTNCSVMHTRKKDMACGHSMLIDPWGERLFEGGEGEGTFSADVDPQKVTDIRKEIPSFNDAKRVFSIQRAQL